MASDGLKIDEIPARMLALHGFPEPRARFAALLVRLTQPDLTDSDASDMADAAVDLINPMADEGAALILFNTVERHLDAVPSLGPFLLRLHERMPDGVELGLARCERLLRRVLGKRVSDIQAPGQLRDLHLPTVPPLAPAR